MTSKSGLQRGQQRQTLFAQGGQIATNSTKRLCPSKTTETAGDLLLDLDHTKIALGEIVVKIHAQILEEGEDGFLLFAQAIEQIASVALFAATPLARGSGCPRVKLIPFVEQAQKLGFPIHNFPEIQTAFSQCACLIGCVFHLQKQL